MNIFLSHGTGGAVCLAHAPVPLCRPSLRAVISGGCAGPVDPPLVGRLLPSFFRAQQAYDSGFVSISWSIRRFALDWPQSALRSTMLGRCIFGRSPAVLQDAPLAGIVAAQETVTHRSWAKAPKISQYLQRIA